jgi:hypothetical protein
MCAELIMTSVDEDLRQQLMLDTLDALREWREEIEAVNDRCLSRTLERMAVAQRAVGWPDHTTAKTGYAAVASQ